MSASPGDLIPHSRPLLPDDFREVTSRLTPGWVADGPCTEAFERRAAAALGWEQGVATNSGTSALHLALLGLGVGAGDEVVIPAYVCVAVLNAVVMTGATPVAADSEPGGFNICPKSVEVRLTRRTKAIVAAHLFGERARMEELVGLGPPVVEDCAQSFGAVQDGQPVGSTGAVAVASFYATKVITTGVGGLVAGPPELHARILDRREYDKRDDWQLRFSYKMDELSAALGLWQLDELPEMIARRGLIARQYEEKWSKLPVRQRSIKDRPLIYRYTIRGDQLVGPLLARLMERGIGASRPVNAPLSRITGNPCPEAEKVFAETCSIPIYPSLSDPEVDQVTDAVLAILA